ncbi:hypothetical protein BDP27DRAFT_1432666 [Rhodocollybia butyracea]|uniref:Uncharacterized protein n=1 Tax=Rhodocollybia butyracea TaxID=206335 RepID=A0A9P5P745_9AGAR|nr:hypothetical protein BDP27DRAFT_1432666 [Rhodocollybia butyracea]
MPNTVGMKTITSDAPANQDLVVSNHRTDTTDSINKNSSEYYEWLTLNFRDDFAFKSFLRVIHRCAPHAIGESSFISAVPDFRMPYSTPDTHPSVSLPFSSSFGFGQRTPYSAWRDLDQQPIVRKLCPLVIPEGSAMPLTLPDISSMPITNLNDNVIPIPSSSSAAYLDYRQGPMVHNAQPLNANHGQLQIQQGGIKSPLPYPEWRLDIVIKAQRAGMGELTKDMNQFLWQDSHRPRSSPLTGLKYDTGSAASGLWGQKITAIGEDGTSGFMAADSDNHLSAVERPPASRLSLIENTDSLLKVSSDNGDLDLDLDDGEEHSDDEWDGWMVDIHRQARIFRNC